MPAGCLTTLSRAALPVAEQSARASAVTGVGVKREHTVSRAGTRMIGRERPALRVPRAPRGGRHLLCFARDRKDLRLSVVWLREIDDSVAEMLVGYRLDRCDQAWDAGSAP